MVAQYRDTHMPTATIDEESEIEDDVKGAVHRRRGVGIGHDVRKWDNAPDPFSLPKEGLPTEAPPGTVEKALVMTIRASRREGLFHAYDAQWEGDLRPLLFYLEMCEKRESRCVKVNGG